MRAKATVTDRAAWLRLLLAVVFSLAVHSLALAGPPEKSFSVLHCSDVHIGPYRTPPADRSEIRGAATISWLVAEAAKPQSLDEKLTLPAPSLGIITGDITEFGVIDATWDVVEDAFRGLPFPWLAVTGNHDNTWGSLYDVMRRRHGGENYVKEHGGVHFIVLSSASPQEPVPSLDGKTRAWLAATLEKLGPDAPVVIAFHHPPYSGEFAPAELDTLLDLLRDYNVLAVLYGHGHALEVRDIEGLTGIEGGSTFGKNAGYGVLSFADGMMRYAYRYHQGDPKAPAKKRTPESWVLALEKTIRAKAAPRLFDLLAPEADAVVPAGALPLRLKFAEHATKQPAELIVTIDGKEVLRQAVEAPASEFRVPLDGLIPGAHLLSVRVRQGGEKAAWAERDIRTRIFFIEPPKPQPRWDMNVTPPPADAPRLEVAWRHRLPVGIKAAPRVEGDLLVVPCTDGTLAGFERRTGRPAWKFPTGGEILATPAWTGEFFVVGSGDGNVYAVDREGRKQWTYPAGRPVYGMPLFHDGTIYVGDNGGMLHAIAAADGSKRWVFERADFAIEGAPVRWGDLLVFGAWDGYVYAVSAADGALKWKSLGPKASDGKGVRYYAATDCGPVVFGDRLFICDRGYDLGAYDVEGKLGLHETTKVSGITVDPAGKALYCRHLEDRVRRLDASAATIWERPVPAGRFPIPPTVRDGRVYVCSNTGLLSVLGAEDGKLLARYQATPGFFVMAGVAVDRDGVAYVAGMDGLLTALRLRGGPAASGPLDGLGEIQQ